MTVSGGVSGGFAIEFPLKEDFSKRLRSSKDFSKRLSWDFTCNERR
jgi:hypothetical protein